MVYDIKANLELPQTITRSDLARPEINGQREPSAQLGNGTPGGMPPPGLVVSLPKGGQPLTRQASNMTVKPSFKRYVILLLFAINSGNKAFQWIQVSASTNKIAYFYGVEHFVINITSVVFMLSFVPLSLPACFLIDRIGMRTSVVLASFGTAVGSIIKCFSCHEGGLHWLFVGLVLVSLSEQMIFSVPSRLASVWFPDKQVSWAVAMCVLGNQFGMALGFLTPQFVLEGVETKEGIAEGLMLIHVATSVVSVLAFVADVIWLDEAPKYPPGQARLKQIEHERNERPEHRATFAKQMGELLVQSGHLLTSTPYVLLNISYGINVGLVYTLETVLNQMLEQVWPGQEIHIGNTGFIIILSGSIAAPFWGKIMDAWRRYKLINILFTLGTIVAFIAFGAAILYYPHYWVVYTIAVLVGVFETGIVIGGLELAVELTYPAPELVTSTLINIQPQVFGTFFVFIGSYIVDYYGNFYTTVFYVSMATTALVLLICTKETLNRQLAAKERERQRLEAQVKKNAQFEIQFTTEEKATC